MKTITVKLPQGSYNIIIGHNILKTTGQRIKERFGSKNYVIVSDENVWALYGETLDQSLREAGHKGMQVIVKPGEASKSLKTFQEVSEKIAEKNYDRDIFILALGGGIVGDLGGFVASVYKRGVHVIQIPTSLVAQVDSSVGGKTALNLAHGKNLIGAFHQPALVIIDTGLLESLDKKQLAEGMAEVIKYGAALDEDFFNILEERKDLSDLEEIVYRSCSIKSDVVELDEKDTGERRKLNFGHSFGHSIEKMGNYQKYSHGQAVAIGMCLAAKLGEEIGLTELGTFLKLERLLEKNNLPTSLPEEMRHNLKEFVEIMEGDKKNQDGKLTIVLLKTIGESFIHKIKSDELLKLMENIKL